MSKNLQAVLSLLLLAAAVFWSLYSTKPHPEPSLDVPQEEFSTSRAFEHVRAMSKEPHYVGSPAHSSVRNYIVSELEKLGLFVQTQEGTTLSSEGVVTRPQNILAKIEGSGDGKSLLLLSHYDSAMHSSYGASDAASGVATILEGLRAYLASGKTPENDIVVVFTDAEELGLNGAALFVNEHPWAEDVGLALNFESRGSGGNSFMLLETNAGNKALLEQFFAADVEYPVTNSLAYSVYKMLPNDTDLTVLREQGNISGLNFAFIDDHFDYHTATDTPENLDFSTLAHQGSYLMPLLNYFSSNSLESFESEEDLVFFNLPLVKMISYSFDWIFPMLILAAILLVILIVFGIIKKKLSPKRMLQGFIPFLIALSLSGILSYALWKFATFIYPQYLEMEHGFTYNGYSYIAAVVFLSLAICFYTYNRFKKPKTTADLFVAPLFFWILLSGLTAFFLKGAAYFVVPVFFGMIQMLILFWRPKFALLIVTLLSLPAIFILMPFIVMFPVALGLKMLFLTGILVTLLWVLLWPVFSFYKKNQLLGFLSFLTFLAFFIIAHFKSDFTSERPKPNSLVYLMDRDRGVATWNTYDEIIDDYTQPYFNEASEEAVDVPKFSSKYNSGFTRSAVAPQITLPEPYIGVEKISDSLSKEDRYRVKIAPNRRVNRIELFSDRKTNFESFTVNGKQAGYLQPEHSDLHVFENRWSDRLLTYYAVNRDTLRMEIGVQKGTHPQISLFEAAYDLFENRQLNVQPRQEGMIPRPFVLNDAIVQKKSFVLE